MPVFNPHPIKRYSCIAVFALIFLAWTGPVPAEEKKPDAPAETAETETIWVTAQKQEQDIKDVPITMSVFDTYALDDMNVENIKDIMAYTPNMSYFHAGAEGVGTPTIRGLTASLRSFGTSTALYVDGIPYTRGFGFDTIVQDIRQIEVLKGPQGTLYGKNAEAGVVNIITQKPGNTFRSWVKGVLGEDNKGVAGAGISGPVVKDKLLIGVSAKHYQKDGFITNTNTGDTVNDQEYDFGKLNMIFTPTDNLAFSLIAQTIQYDNGDLALNNITAADPREVSSDLDGYDKPSSTIGGLTTTYTYNDIKFETVLTYWNYKFDSLNDFDFTSSAAAQNHLRSKNAFEKISGEFRVSSKAGPVTWLLGGYADRDDDKVDNVQTFSFGQAEIIHDLGAGNLSAFAHADWDITDRLALIGGIRYDNDEKEFTEASSSTDEKDDYSAISPKLAVRYKVTPDSMVFATASRGYRAGGFNSFAPSFGQAQNLSYDKETVWNYEIGSKAGFFNNRLVLNLAVFYMDIKDMQVESAVDATYTWIQNAAEAVSKGIELEAQFRATDTIKLFTSCGYTDVTFDQFSDANGDYSGNTSPYAPKYNLSVGAQYRSHAGWFARIDATAYGRMYLDKANQYKRDAFALLNAKIGYEGESFDAYISANNIFDEEYDSTGYYEGRYTLPSPPREVALSVAYRF
ncbi:MAG: TonB-dependent receptor [Desulfobacterales bacterium]|nr:TonB-dependent receptor [Desulfobacterales bacterium]